VSGADPLAIEPIDGALGERTVVVPGSKSITNRALVCAALAEGTSTLTNVLHADDTEAMVGCLQALGVEITVDWDATLTVEGCGGAIPATEATLDCRLSGTTSRFILPVAGLGSGRYEVDGGAPLRRRPMGPTIQALRQLGVNVDERGEPDHLPLELSEGPSFSSGAVTTFSDTSSQFLSGLLLSGPCVRGDDLVVALPEGSALVSQPYVDMTVAVMDRFGAPTHRLEDGGWLVRADGYRSVDLTIEPDASAASYFFAAAALLGGSVTVEGLGTESLQGDVAFVDVLEQMGAEVERSTDRITVSGTGVLHGGVFDFTHISDTAQTLAAIAPFADSPVSVTGIGFIRGKETDRIAAVVTELQRTGIEATEQVDGFVVHPGTPQPAVTETYDDHRMAMAFALVGLKVPGIRIADPGCVDKTFPRYWKVLDALRP